MNFDANDVASEIADGNDEILNGLFMNDQEDEDEEETEEEAQEAVPEGQVVSVDPDRVVEYVRNRRQLDGRVVDHDQGAVRDTIVSIRVPVSADEIQESDGDN
jgi:hypothetical protein